MAVKALKTSLNQFFTYCVEKNVPFAFYRLPGTTDIRIVAQKNNTTYLSAKADYTRKGFAFAPFTEDKNCKAILIHADIEATEHTLPALNFVKAGSAKIKPQSTTIKETGKKAFKRYVASARKWIRKGDYIKLVTARVAKHKKPEDFDAVSFFKSLCAKYKAAFVSLTYTPAYGLWIGASPEILLQVKGNKFTTYSLAGTKPDAKTKWGNKEKEEQQIVSDYLVQTFKQVTAKTPVISGPETITAGNMQHLLTTFTYTLNKAQWQGAVNVLHPTPAVAGMPKNKAIRFILKHEKAPRGFYSGYLGPVNLQGQINLFVNLRCMRVLKNHLGIYVGCGITAHSAPEKEWRETELKSQTLLSVLNPPKA